MNEFMEAWRAHAKQAKKFNRAGMTLIEIMIVITLMAALMAVIGVNVMGAQDRANVKMAEMDLQTFKHGCAQYKSFFRKYPNSLEDLINTPDGNPILEGDKVPQDPWGNDYFFEKTGNKIKVYSAGNDGLENTEDDITLTF